jgi:hypothetical protein
VGGGLDRRRDGWDWWEAGLLRWLGLDGCGGWHEWRRWDGSGG